MINNKIPIVSAREEFEHIYPSHSVLWKEYSFLCLRNYLDYGFSYESLTNLIVIGDSKYEMNAGIALGNLLKKCNLKCIKFYE